MLFAYGGARATISGCPDQNGGGTFKVKMADLYEWVKDDELLDPVKEGLSKMASPAYNSAAYLEAVRGFKTFRHELEFELKCDSQ